MTDTTQVPIDVLISKVEKLWRQANHNGTSDAEREIFERKALQLMEEHRITEAMLDLGYEDVLGDHLFGELNGRNARIQIDLINTVARAFDCRVWWSGYGLRYRVMIFGFKSDFERTKALGSMLLIESLSGASKLKGYYSGDTIAQRRGFMQGFTRAIQIRLQAAQTDARQEAATHTATAGAALVLVERGKRVAAEYSKRRFRSASGIMSGARTGYDRGVEAGRNTSLTPNNRIGSRKALER